MQSIHFFAGSNTARGFYSCFENILPADMRRRMFFIKGGPGVGKSTLMRRVGAYAEEKGLKAIYFHCSSDPDSLDGVCLPERGIGLMDATAPHVYDPVIRMPERSSTFSSASPRVLHAATGIWPQRSWCFCRRRLA